MKTTFISIIIALILILSALVFVKNNKVVNSNNINNVSIIDGKQIIEINVKGGYQPTESIAKAGIYTIIRFNTANTFDCSASIRIPSINISKLLPQTGLTDIDIGIQTVSTLKGICGMGMYKFQIKFGE